MPHPTPCRTHVCVWDLVRYAPRLYIYHLDPHTQLPLPWIIVTGGLVTVHWICCGWTVYTQLVINRTTGYCPFVVTFAVITHGCPYTFALHVTHALHTRWLTLLPTRLFYTRIHCVTFAPFAVYAHYVLRLDYVWVAVAFHLLITVAVTHTTPPTRLLRYAVGFWTLNRVLPFTFTPHPAHAFATPLRFDYTARCTVTFGAFAILLLTFIYTVALIC